MAEQTEVNELQKQIDTLTSKLAEQKKTTASWCHLADVYARRVVELERECNALTMAGVEWTRRALVAEEELTFVKEIGNHLRDIANSPLCAYKGRNHLYDPMLSDAIEQWDKVSPIE